MQGRPLGEYGAVWFGAMEIDDSFCGDCVVLGGRLEEPG